MPSQDDLAALQKMFYTLYNSLKDAYWAASTVESKDQIHGAEDLVNEILDALDREDLESDNDAMADLTKTLKDSIKDLSDLQNKLAVIVHNVSIANTAIQAINAALTAAAKIADAA
jgi:predicted component of type VI protein secretion system